MYSVNIVFHECSTLDDMYTLLRALLKLDLYSCSTQRMCGLWEVQKKHAIVHELPCACRVGAAWIGIFPLYYAVHWIDGSHDQRLPTSFRWFFFILCSDGKETVEPCHIEAHFSTNEKAEVSLMYRKQKILNVYRIAFQALIQCTHKYIRYSFYNFCPAAFAVFTQGLQKAQKMHVWLLPWHYKQPFWIKCCLSLQCFHQLHLPLGLLSACLLNIDCHKSIAQNFYQYLPS